MATLPHGPHKSLNTHQRNGRAGDAGGGDGALPCDHYHGKADAQCAPRETPTAGLRRPASLHTRMHGIVAHPPSGGRSGVGARPQEKTDGDSAHRADLS